MLSSVLITRRGHFHVICPQSLYPWTLLTVPPLTSPCRADGAPWQQSPLSTGLLWFGKETWRLSFVFNTSDLLCFKISPSHEQMPHNGTASQAASTALHSPLAAVGEKAMQIILFQRSEQNKRFVAMEGWNGGGGVVLGRITDQSLLFKIRDQSMCFLKHRFSFNKCKCREGKLVLSRKAQTWCHSSLQKKSKF